VIPGLDLDLQTEQMTWRAFDGWADQFRRRLASGGCHCCWLTMKSLSEPWRPKVAGTEQAAAPTQGLNGAPVVE